MIERTCHCCSKIFLVYPSLIRKGYGKYCSLSCSGKNRVPWNKGKKTNLVPWNKQIPIDKKCLNCHKIFSVVKWEQKRKFCSLKCKSEDMKGLTPWNKNSLTKNCLICKKEFYVGHARKTKRNQRKHCSIKCRAISQVGKEGWSKGKPRYNMRGENHPMWNGGSKDERNNLMQQIEYKNWRKEVFERDNYACQICGIRAKKGLGKRVSLEADHIKPWATFPNLRYVIDNGRTLCRSCHMQTPSWGVNIHKKGFINING